MSRDELRVGFESALSCLALVCRVHGIECDVGALLHAHGPAAMKGRVGDALLQAAKSLGFRAGKVEIDWSRLLYKAYPAICMMRGGGWATLLHYGAVSGHDADCGTLVHPDGSREVLSLQGMKKKLEGTAVLLTPRGGARSDALLFDFSYVMGHMNGRGGEMFVLVLATFTATLLGLAMPLGYQAIIDKVLTHRAYATLGTIGAILVFAVLMQRLLLSLRDYLIAHMGFRLDAVIGLDVFRRVVGQGMEFFDSKQVGVIAQRVGEVEVLRMLFVNGVVTLFVETLTSMLYLVLLFWLNPRLATMVLVALSLLLLITLAAAPVIRLRVRRNYERRASNHGYVVETLRMIRTVKAEALEPGQVEGWKERVASQASTGMEAASASVATTGMVQGVVSLMSVGVLVYGAHEVITGSISPGTLVAFSMISGMMVQPVLRLSQLWQQFQEAQVAMARVAELAASPGEDAGGGIEPSEGLEGRVTFDRVSFAHEGSSRKVLDEVSFSAEPGTVLVVMGPSGSGKTTLVSLLQRHHKATSGRVLLDGHNVDSLGLTYLRRKAGFMLQSDRLFDGTVRQNIAKRDPGMGLDEVQAAARLAGADGFITDELEDGYETQVGEGGSRLSGGQRQRVALARSLATDPSMLALDEPTSELDAESVERFRRSVPEFRRGRTLIMVTHDPALHAQSDKILMLEGGKVVGFGTQSELIAEGGKYAEYLKNAGSRS